MSQILTCVLCGRRGTQRFVMVAPDPNDPHGGHRARCQDRRACRRRIDDAHTTETAGRPTGPATADEDPGQRFAPADSVAGLAREVDGLRRDLDRLRGLPAQVDDVARVVGELAEQVSSLAARPGKAPALSWLDLPADEQAARDLLADLAGWLGQVYLRYGDAARTLPDCWLWHPDVIEELLWLQQAWQTAYRSPAASVALAGDWHDRYRPGVVKRIKTLTGSCSIENHQTRDGDQPQGAPVVPLAELASDPIAHWWATAREQPAPEPTDEQITASTPRHRGGTRR